MLIYVEEEMTTMITIILSCLYIRCILFQISVGLLVMIFLIFILLFDDIMSWRNSYDGFVDIQRDKDLEKFLSRNWYEPFSKGTSEIFHCLQIVKVPRWDQGLRPVKNFFGVSFEKLFT